MVRTNKLLALVIGLLSLLGYSWFLTAQEPTSGQTSKRLLALLIADTLDPTIGSSVEKDAENFELLLKDAFDKQKERLVLTKLTGKQCNREAVLEYFKNLPPCPDDTLLVYFAGHGATHRSLGHVLALNTDAGKPSLFLRSELRNLILSKKPRLAILLSDACGDFLDKAPDISREPLLPDWKVIEALFLRPQGLVDINSVSEGESALGSKEGGYFSLNLLNTLRKDLFQLFPGPDGSLFWHDVIPLVQEKAQQGYDTYRRRSLAQLTDKVIESAKTPEEKQRFAEMRNFLTKQEYQTIRVFHLPSQWRFGARLLENDGDGVKIAFVHEGTPAALAGFKPGDIVKKVGDRPIRSLEQFFAAIANLQGEVPFEFRRGRSPLQAKVQLGGERLAGQDF
jgi:hypothetical protein